jgi:hypothetical protein
MISVAATILRVKSLLLERPKSLFVDSAALVEVLQSEDVLITAIHSQIIVFVAADLPHEAAL